MSRTLHCMSVTTDMALEHPAKDAMNAGLHRKCNFCTSAGLFARRFKLGLTDRAGDHTGLICHLHCWVLTAITAAFFAATVRAHKKDGGWLSRRSGHWSAQSLPRPKLAHGRSFEANFIVDLKQWVHYGETETFMFETSTG